MSTHANLYIVPQDYRVVAYLRSPAACWHATTTGIFVFGDIHVSIYCTMQNVPKSEYHSNRIIFYL